MKSALFLLAPFAVQFVAGSHAVSSYNTSSSGEPGTLDYRVYTLKDGERVSAWQGVPLYGEDGTMNMVCEIPANTTAKFEVFTKLPGNPIAQDEKNGLPRNYAVPILWNYGMFPQTWEDPEVTDENLGDFGGDNDPLDVVELGAGPCTTGQVYSVKPICAFATIDDGQIDWKVVVLPSNKAEAAAINSAADAEEAYPGELADILEWLKYYKTVKNVNGTLEPSGDPPMEFGYDEACVDGDVLASVIESKAALYDALASGQRNNTEGLALQFF